MRARPVTLLIVTLLLVVQVAPWGAPAHAEAPPSVLVMAKALDDLITLDPAEVFEFSGAEVIANLYERLFAANPIDPARPHGVLAEAYGVEDEGRRFIFRIRADRRFASGRTVDAKDVAYSLRRVVHLNKTPAFILTQFGLDTETVDDRIQVIDARHISLTLDRAYAPTLVLNALSAGIASIVDRETVQAHERDGDFGHGWLRRASAGSGAFLLERWNPGEHLILDAVPDHPTGTPALERVILLDVREPATQRLMLERGDIDMARNLGPDQIRALASAEGISVWSAPSARLFYLGLNQKNEMLAHSGVRRAMRWLIDYDAITDALLGGSAEARQVFLPEGMLGAIDDAPFYLDPLMARALLAEAGLVDGFDITLETHASPRVMQIAQAIQATMAEGGIRVEIVPGDSAQTLTKYRARRHAIYIGSWGPDYLDPHSNAAAFAYNPDNDDGARDKTLAWRNGWYDEAVNALTEAAVVMSDPVARAAAYGELQQSVQADSPFILLFQDRTLFAARDSVRDFISGPMPDQIAYRSVSKQAAP